MQQKEDIIFPDLNRRLKILIEELTDGNVAEFVRISKISSHQVLNRIFSIDARTGKYPSPSSAILNSIKIHLPNVNYDWLITGEGEMLKNQESSAEYPGQNVSDNIMIPREAWEVIRDQAASLKTKDKQMSEIIAGYKEKDGQIKDVIAILKEQIKKGEDVGDQRHAAPREALG